MRHALALACAGACALLAGDHLIEGNAGSSVRVVIYEDLQCPDCASFPRMLDEHLLPRFREKAAFEPKAIDAVIAQARP